MNKDDGQGVIKADTQVCESIWIRDFKTGNKRKKCAAVTNKVGFIYEKFEVMPRKLGR